MNTNARKSSRQTTATTRFAALAFQGFSFAGATSPAVALLLLAALTLACGGGDNADGRPDSIDAEAADIQTPEVLAGAFEVVRSLELEENDQVMIVRPMVTAGAPGELLVVDPLEGQVRIYSTSGELLDHLGGMGEGPGEFTMPMFAHRTLEGGLVVADPVLNRLTFYGPGAEAEPEVATPELSEYLAALQLDPDRYLLTGYNEGSEGRGRGRYLHIWNRSTDVVERSFLRLNVPDEMVPLAGTVRGVVAVMEGDTIWALRALADTLYKFDRDGVRLGTFALSPFEPAGPADGHSPFDAIVEAANVFVLAENRIAVQFLQTQGNEAIWSLVVVDRQGNEFWRAQDTPRLYVVDQDDLFYFKDPTTVLPNHWLVARLRSDL